MATSLIGGMLDELDDNERFCLISDAWALVESGQITAAAYLELAQAYRAESEQAIWQSVLGGLGAIRKHIVTDDDLDAYRVVVGDLIRPTFEALGWEASDTDSDLTRRLRGLVVGAMGRLVEDADVVERSTDLAQTWIDSADGLDPDVALAALFTYAAHGADADYDSVFAAYETAESPQTKLKLLQALVRLIS